MEEITTKELKQAIYVMIGEGVHFPVIERTLQALGYTKEEAKLLLDEVYDKYRIENR
jgi:hypothetical protein